MINPSHPEGPMTSTKPRIRVSKPLPSTPWAVYCDACSPFGMAFMHLRLAESHAVAVAWAHQHARKHTEVMCPVCEHVGPIQDDSRHVEVSK